MLPTHPNHPYMALSLQDAALSAAAPALLQTKPRPLLPIISAQTLAQWF